MRHVVTLTVAILGFAQAASALQWPFDNSSGPHWISAVVGEYRDTGAPHFHDGVDITTAPTTAGTNVRSVLAGTVVSFCSNCGGENFVAIGSAQGTYIYAHVDPSVAISTGASIPLAGLIGSGSSNFNPAHLHFKVTNSAGSQVQNPLLPPSAGFNNYADTVWPQVLSLALYNADTGAAISASNKTNVPRLKVRAKAKDLQSLGSSNVGIFSIGYQVRNITTGETVVPATIKQSYDVIPVANLYIPGYAYDTSASDLSNYYYFANNLLVGPAPIDLTNKPDGVYEICVFTKDIKGNGGDIANQRGAACQNVTLDRTGPTVSFSAGGSPFTYATSTPVVTVQGIDPSGIYSIKLEGGVSYSSTNYVSGVQTTASNQFPDSPATLADGSYNATVTDLAGNVSVSVALSVKSIFSGQSQTKDAEGNQASVYTTSQSVVGYGENSPGIASFSLSPFAGYPQADYSCGAEKSTSAIYGPFSDLPTQSYTFTATDCAGNIKPSTFTVVSGQRIVTLDVGGLGSNLHAQSSEVSADFINTHWARIYVCENTGSCFNCTSGYYLKRKLSPLSGNECLLNGCCEYYDTSTPGTSISFTVTNTTNTDFTGGLDFSGRMLTGGSIDLIISSAIAVSMAPGAGYSGRVGVPQIGQAYPTTSADNKVIAQTKFLGLQISSKTSSASESAAMTQQNKRASSTVYDFHGSYAIFTSTLQILFSYQDSGGVTTDTTTLRIYRFDGIDWSSAAITQQYVWKNATTGVITSSGAVTRTGIYAALFEGQDSSAPVTSFAFQGSSYTFDGALLVSTDAYAVLTATDPVVNGFASTVATVTYRFDPSSGTAYSIYTSSIALPLSTHVLEYRAYDYAGNAEAVKTATFTVTAGTAFRNTSDHKVAGTFLAGFLGAGAKAEVVSRAENDYTLLMSSPNRQALLGVSNIGGVAVGPQSPQARLDLGQDNIALQLRSGNMVSTGTAVQMSFAYDGDASMRHALATYHSTSTDGNRMDFLLWTPAAGSTATLATTKMLSLQAINTASNGSMHVCPYGEPDAELEVSDGAAAGGGTIQLSGWYMPSSKRFKSDIKALGEREEDRALAETAALRHVRYRYKGQTEERPAMTGLIYEDAPESLRADEKTISQAERLANAELALKAAIRRLEALEKRYRAVKARRQTP